MRRFQSKVIHPVAIGTLCLSAIVWSIATNAARSESHSYLTDDPEIEMWFYPVSSGNGLGSVRDRAPTFAAFSTTVGGEQVAFYEGSGFDPTRRGSFIVVGNTSTTIPRLDDPTRYRIDALRVTATLLGGIGPIAYDNTPEDVLELTTAGGDDPGRPIELWGIGLDGSYMTFGFSGESGAEYFNEGDRRWPISGGSFTGPYQLYSIDPEGRDVENAVVGGYSATEVDHHTEQFTPTPFAVGKVYDETQIELTPGTTVPVGSKFVFEPDLSNPGIIAYIQQSLAAGHLGFFFSSLHEPLGHTGTAAYPDFFLDNNPDGPNPNGNGPTFELHITILDPLPGDYNQDGVVNAADYVVWRDHLGASAGTLPNDPAGGAIGQAQYIEWKANFGARTDASFQSNAVPEPSSIAIATIASIAALAACRRSS